MKIILVIAAAALAGRASLAAPVTAGYARFSVLTESLVRMEWAPDTHFVDAPSLIFENAGRMPPFANFTAVRSGGGGVVITTPRLRLDFHPVPNDTQFTSANLEVSFELNATTRAVWAPGDSDSENLKGTLYSMDCYDDPAVCQAKARSNIGDGLVSRSGWALIDDAQTARWVGPSTEASSTSSWNWWARAPPTSLPPGSTSGTGGKRTDHYLFAHGHRYTEALADFALVAGKMDMPPLSAFGIWWSRYWVYSVRVPEVAQDIVSDVLEGYRDHALPLNHLVMDTNWHSQSSQYSWNTTIIRDPAAWMAELHSDNNTLGHPLKYLVNLHPNGVGGTESHYPEFAKQMKNKGGPAWKCDLSDPAFASAYFDWMMGAKGAAAAPNNGIDYWWTDWGGCGQPSGGNIGSLWWSNYLYHQDQSRTGNGKRGLVLSRFGGLGTHRYGVGFSGDAPQSYHTLQMQVEMTPKASNVLFGYWSHDIGGFHNGTVIKGFAKGYPYVGDEDPSDPSQSEMFLRWLQFATFSPIFRTHCQLEPVPQANICDPTRNAHCTGCERRIWKFIHHYPLMKDAMVLRNGLAPYIYTAVRAAYDSSVGILHPLYYDHPEAEEAYQYQNTQYKFGGDMIVAPITEAAVDSPVNGSINKTVWLPEGAWVEWGGEVTHHGPILLNQRYTQAEVPVFVKTTAVIPMKTMSSVAAVVPGTLVWLLFPAAGAGSGSGQAYEDDGETVAAKADTVAGREDTRHSSVTTARWSGDCHEGGNFELTIATVGWHIAMPETRKHALQLRGCHSPPRATAVNGVPLPQQRNTAATTSSSSDGGGSREPSGEAGWWMAGGGDDRGTTPTIEPSLLHGDANTLFVGLGEHRSRNGATVTVTLKF